jgi:short-subunit dehydrogenase
VQLCNYYYTGANTGIGQVTAHELSKKGARVIILCRNTEKGEAAASQISEDTGNPVDVIKLDLSSLKTVRECAQMLLDKEEKIDILINNAGNTNVRYLLSIKMLAIFCNP